MESLAVRRVCIPAGDAPGDGPQTALVVTSDENLANAAARALNDAGYDVLAAAHSGHALLASRTSGHIDVLLTELMMEETSGPTLATQLRRDHPDLRAIYFAPSGTPSAEGLLVRPFSRHDLMARLEAAVASASPRPPAPPRPTFDRRM